MVPGINVCNLHSESHSGEILPPPLESVCSGVVSLRSVRLICFKQNTCDTSACGSEFVAARTATDQVIDLRLTLRYLGVPIYRSVMFGDNESVVTSSAIPHSQLNKRWTALSYHRVREAIAAQVFEFWHVPGDENPADIVSKHWANNKASHVLRPLMFWRGDTLDCVSLS